MRALAAILLAGCAGAPDEAPEMLLQEAKPLATGAEQHERLCGRRRQDPVIDLFCAGAPPEITGFVELRDALDLGRTGDGDYQGFAISGHSTALGTRVVSAINPRVMFVRPEGEGGELLSLAFARGEQFSEIVTRDRANAELRFYLVTFTQECNARDGGCLPGELLTEVVETGWRDVNVYAEEDLANTPLDCLVCHQPDGPGTLKLLRMQELEPPWNHWFYNLVEGGRALIADYQAAKGDEMFAGLTGEQIAKDSQPGLLSSTLFFADSGEQPNVFVSAVIEREVKESAAPLGGNQPVDNSVPGQSPTWQAIYDRAKRGKEIAVPYHDVKVTDQGKLASMTQAYVDYHEGRLPREELPDLREIRPDDPELLAHMGLGVEPGLDGDAILLQACGQCHNDKLDQALSRARFNVDLGKIDRTERARAVARIALPEDDPRVMPPRLFRRLDADAKERLTELLED